MNRSKRYIHHGFDQGRTNQPEKVNPTAHMPKNKLPPFQTFSPDQEASQAALNSFRKLAPIQLDDSSAAQNISQQAPSAQSVYMPTHLSLSKRPSRPNRIEDLLNPTDKDTTGAGGRQHDGNGLNSQWTTSIAATSRPATPPAAAVGKRPLRDISLPSITSALGDQAPASIGSDSLQPSKTRKASDRLRAAHPSPAPRSSSRVQTQSVQSGHPASRNSSASSAIPQLDSTSGPQSHVSTPSSTMGPPPTLPQGAFNKRAFDVRRSEVSHQRQCSFTDLEQVPPREFLDSQAASKGADYRWRQRRKEKEQENSNKLLELEAYLEEITEEKERYQLERDLWKGVVQRRGIPIPPRPPLPRRRGHASLSEPHIADTETAQTGDRNALNNANPYGPQG